MCFAGDGRDNADDHHADATGSATSISSSQTDGCYYSVLQVPPSATLTDITKAYHAAALLYHPDRQRQRYPSSTSSSSSCCDHGECSNNDSMFLRIQEAWECLRCPDLRRSYDATRKQAQIQRDHRLHGAMTVELCDCVERSVDMENYSNGSGDQVVELIFSCRCGQELFVGDADPDEHNLLTCHGCSLLYNTTPLWKEGEANEGNDAL